MTDPLQKLFGSQARLKILRLFLFNPRQTFTLPEAAARARVTEREARREIRLLESIRLIASVRRSSRTKGAHYVLNDNFSQLENLQNLLLNVSEQGGKLYERIRRTGTIKLIMLSGIFMGEWDGRLDVLIVGDRIKEPLLRARIRNFESEIGKELKFAILGSDEFLYRLSMNDHLLRDLLDYPHKIVFDRLNIGLK